ncbi:MAG: hypothetical protein GY804_02865 [Alphaproteobacteria bacterium]|nr:hypothetical protein [Alphaproteobacteria bacterium]
MCKEFTDLTTEEKEAACSYIEDEIKCPYCGFEQESSEYETFGGGNFHDGANELIHCHSCDEDFNCELHLSTAFTTSVLTECQEKGHDWGKLEKSTQIHRAHVAKCEREGCNARIYAFDKDSL